MSQMGPHFCQGCGQPLNPGASSCPNCGARQAGSVAAVPSPRWGGGQSVFCRACGRAINVAAPWCPGCGAPQAVTAEGEKSRVVAVALALLLGGFGIHKFYLGQVGRGILYLLFCWTFIPAIIAFIEAIVYLCMTDARFAEKYG